VSNYTNRSGISLMTKESKEALIYSVAGFAAWRLLAFFTSGGTAFVLILSFLGLLWLVVSK